MQWVRLELAAAEARKAEGASCTALQIPSPSDFTGSDTWVQVASSRLMLVMSLTIDLKILSYL